MKTIKITVTILLTIFFNGVHAAPPPPPGGGPGCWPPPCIPVDGGVVFLAIAGALFVAKKLYDFSQKRVTS